MFCKNRITLIGHLGKDSETRVTTKGTAYSRFSITTNVSWKDKDSGEYRTRTEWHACVVWAKLGAWAASLKKGDFVEVEGELRYSEYQPKGSDLKIRSAEIHVSSILTLDRAENSETDETVTGESSNDDDTPFYGPDLGVSTSPVGTPVASSQARIPIHLYLPSQGSAAKDCRFYPEDIRAA